MARTIFFSWQADAPTLVGRNLIERALERALGKIGADTELEEARRELEIDRDTKDVPGSPPIVDTIFAKIDGSAVFLPDLTFVGHRLDGRPTPNPNVLIEYGWALKSLGHARMLPVMNTAFGEPSADSMPFDMRHLRNPISYHCLAEATEADRRVARDALAKTLESAIRLILTHHSDASTTPPLAFARADENGGPGRFRPAADALRVDSDDLGTSAEVRLIDGPVSWLRVMPIAAPATAWDVADLERVAWEQGVVRPLNREWNRLSYFRAHDGFGVYPPCGRGEDPTYGTVMLFKSGEIWSVDAYRPRNRTDDERDAFVLREDHFVRAFSEYLGLLGRLGLQPPLRWEAGVDGLKSLGLIPPIRPNHFRAGPAARGSGLIQTVRSDGIHELGRTPAESLRPFFRQVYEAFGLVRPDWHDDVHRAPGSS